MLPEPSDFELRVRGEITAKEYVRRLEARIAERRNDSEFMGRMRRIMREDTDVLQRLKDGGD